MVHKKIKFHKSYGSVRARAKDLLKAIESNVDGHGKVKQQYIADEMWELEQAIKGK